MNCPLAKLRHFGLEFSPFFSSSSTLFSEENQRARSLLSDSNRRGTVPLQSKTKNREILSRWSKNWCVKWLSWVLFFRKRSEPRGIQSIGNKSTIGNGSTMEHYPPIKFSDIQSRSRYFEKTLSPHAQTLGSQGARMTAVVLNSIQLLVRGRYRLFMICQKRTGSDVTTAWMRRRV